MSKDAYLKANLWIYSYTEEFQQNGDTKGNTKGLKEWKNYIRSSWGKHLVETVLMCWKNKGKL